eukprot:TRINITY_DN18656_c0_g3_i1.p1 TRINITY_DN18656_c0_g3~~TRINITY_DN18656_c0_g3_i1.p1  ORF type:complete len:393 (-),score=80.14 TRINITY_DN18656_c0_g3_i1:176-1354(-)
MSGKTAAELRVLVNTSDRERALASSGEDRQESDLSRQYSALLTPEQVAEQAAQDENYQAILAKGTVITDVPVNCWSALIFVVVDDFPDLVAMHTSAVQRVRILFALVMFTMNLLIQGTILFFIYKQLMMPSFKSAQNLYKEFHDEAYVHGHFDSERFGRMSEEKQSDICGLALSHALICRILIFLWVSTNMHELAICFSNIRLVAALPRLPPGLDSRLMVKDVKHVETSQEFWIVCADLQTKICLIVLVYVPKTLVAIILTSTGCLWLLASESFGDLILNSLALIFVTDVDEMLAAAFFPTKFQEDLVAMGYASQEDEDAQDTSKMASKEMCAYLFQLAILTMSCLIVVAMHTYQPVLPGFVDDVKSACVDYWKTQLPWCLPFQGEDCFPTS